MKCVKLNVSYENKKVLFDISVNFSKGKINTILGRNGCGKSTLLKSLSRQLKIDKGTIFLDFKDINSYSQKEFSKKISMLFQESVCPLDLTVKQLVSYGRYPHKSFFENLNQDDEDIILKSMEMTNTIDMKDKKIDELSSGQRQLVWIAMLIAQESDYLLLDEPTTYLDLYNQMEILKCIKKLNKNLNKTIIMILHDINLASQFSDNIIIIKNGNVYDHGCPKDVITEKMLTDIYDVKSKIYYDNETPFVMIKDIVDE